MIIKAIETQYKGYRFRSRLEARWAVFFDALGVQWEYEPEGYDLGDAGWYLPDFWLPEYEWIIEIKGNLPTVEEELKIELLRGIESVDQCGILSGNIPPPGSPVVTINSSIMVIGDISIDTENVPQRFENLIETGYSGGPMIGCPVCGDAYIHMRDCTDGEWAENQEAVFIRFWGGCGHSFTLRFGSHKGCTHLEIVDITEEQHIYDIGLILANFDEKKRDKALKTARSARFEHK